MTDYPYAFREKPDWNLPIWSKWQHTPPSLLLRMKYRVAETIMSALGFEIEARTLRSWREDFDDVYVKVEENEWIAPKADTDAWPTLHRDGGCGCRFMEYFPELKARVLAQT